MIRWVSLVVPILLIPAPASYLVVPAAGVTELTIAVRINSEPPSFIPRRVALSKQRTIVVRLDLGEDIYGQEIKVSAKNSSGHYRIFERYRTSMTVMGEGPHLDLVDWRHFDSSWILLNSLDDMRFQTLASDRIDSSRFPRVTKAEMLNAVRVRARQGWGEAAQLVTDCRGPNDYPCAVMMSSIFLRVEKQIRGRWVHVGLVELRIPMGC